MSKELGSIIVIQFTEPITEIADDAAEAFTVKGKEPKVFNFDTGDFTEHGFIEQQYKVDNVDYHPDYPDGDVIRLHFDYHNKFRNVYEEEDITIVYDGTTEALKDEHGNILSFMTTFNPEDLEYHYIRPLNNHGCANISLSGIVSSTFIEIHRHAINGPFTTDFSQLQGQKGELEDEHVDISIKGEVHVYLIDADTGEVVM